MLKPLQMLLFLSSNAVEIKQLQKVCQNNPIREQSNSCPFFYPVEHAFGSHSKLAFVCPHVSDTLIKCRAFAFCFDLWMLSENLPIPNRKG